MSTPPPSKKRRPRTTIQPDNYIFQWHVEDFPSFSHAKGEKVYSPSFFTGGDKIKWQLALYPRGHKTDDEVVTLFLCLESKTLTHFPITVRCTASIIFLKEVFIEKKFTYEFQHAESHGWHSFVGRDILLNACEAHNSLVIQCKLESLLKIETNAVGHMNCAPSLDLENNRLKDDCCKLYETPNEFTDFTVIAGTRKFAVHKVFLAARSPVFAAMFEHKELKENASNEINIDDLEAPVVQGMLEFIYTDKVKDLPELAPDLIAAAEKYELRYLKAICEQYLHTTLDTENAVAMFILADQYDCPALLKCIKKHVADHSSDIIKTKAYKELNDADILKKLVDFMILK